MQGNQEADTQGTSLFDFETEDSDSDTGSEDRNSEQRVDYLTFISPFSLVSRDDILSRMPDVHREASSMTPNEIGEALGESRSCTTGSVRFCRVPGGVEGLCKELDRAGVKYTPTDTLKVWVPSLSVFGESFEGIADGIVQLFEYDFVGALGIIEANMGIGEDEVRLLRHLAEDVPVEICSRKIQAEISTGERSYSGRPPVGFEVDETGQLVPSDDYQNVREVLRLVDSGEVSKRQAAQRIAPSPRTISRILDDRERRDMYQLDYPGGGV